MDCSHLISLSLNPTAESLMGNNLVRAGLIMRQYCNFLNVAIKTNRFASDRQIETDDFNMTRDFSTLETAIIR